MELSRREIHMLLLYEFRSGNTAAGAANKICQIMGNAVTKDRTAQHWFARFKEGDFNLNDLPRSGRPVEFDLDLLKQIIEEDPRVTTRQLAEQFKCRHSTIADYLHDLHVRNNGLEPKILKFQHQNQNCILKR